MKRFLHHCLIISLILSSFSSLTIVQASTQGDVNESIDKAVNYLKENITSDWQNEIGESTMDWYIMSLSAAGELDKIDKNVLTEALGTFSGSSATDYERKILALTAAGEDPRTYILGENLVNELTGQFYTHNQIGSESLLNDDFWGILALISAGVDKSNNIVEDSKNFILDNQNADGGWGYGSSSSTSDVDDTAAAIMALVSAGEDSESGAIKKAIIYLKSQQNDDGGFLGYGSAQSNSDSTSWVLSSLARLGENLEDWQKGDAGPVDFLLARQSEEGYFYWQDSGGVKGNTVYAIIALLEKYFPVAVITPSVPTVNYRIEGSESLVCEGTVEAENVLEVIINASSGCGYSYELAYADTYLQKLNDDEASGMIGWLYFVNWEMGMVSATDYTLNDNDKVLWSYGDFEWLLTRLEVDETSPSLGEEIEITVESYNEGFWQPLEGATIYVGSTTLTSDSAGQASYNMGSLGDLVVYAEKTGFFRSNQENVQVGDSSQKVDLKVKINLPGGTGPQPEISFEVTGGPVDFGELEPGEGSQDQTVTIKNTGEVKIEVGSTIEGDDIFTQNITIDEVSWTDYQLFLEIADDENINLGLEVPLSYNEEGDKTGELVFWAISVE